MNKVNFNQMAKAAGLKTSYSGKDKKMFVSGETKSVKSFIGQCNLKGRKMYSFSIKAG